VAGEPFLFHQLRLLAAHGAHEIVLCVGYLGERIRQIVGTERFGLRISYSFDDLERTGARESAVGPQPAGDPNPSRGPEMARDLQLIGTLGAVRQARPLLGERFLVLYGDTYLRIDYAALVGAWRASGLPATMSVLRNVGRWDTSNATYARGRVLAYDKRAPRAEMRWIDYGLSGLKSSALDVMSADTSDLSDLFHRLAERGLLHGYEATERFFEIGTPAALAETDAFLRYEGRATVKRCSSMRRILARSGSSRSRRWKAGSSQGSHGALINLPAMPAAASLSRNAVSSAARRAGTPPAASWRPVSAK
jgi:NDP-sugar pyrophosphorylase family protein